MKRIESLTDVQQYLLAIASIFEVICKTNHIPYVMLGGTMLGAVRHHGFIPWDDDMDFGVPREHYEKLLDLLEKELPSGYRCLTYKNCDQIIYPFAKIEDVRTCIDDPRLNCPLNEKIGLNIDVFPLDTCVVNSWRIKWVYVLLKLQTLLFVESTSPTFIKNVIRRVVRTLLPINKNVILKKVDTILINNQKGKDIGNIFGRWKGKEIFSSDIYRSTASYVFEGVTLEGVKDYHTYLTQLYGDYMELPSEEKRVAHVDNIYIK